MGMRINTAIGWGMPFDRFVSLLRLPDPGDPTADGWFDHLEAVLGHTRAMRGPPGWPLPVTGPDETVVDLMVQVGYDETTDIVLMPCIGDARIWHRRNDDLDYALIWGPRGHDDRQVPENQVEYLVHGLHPYGDLRMNAAGRDVPRADRGDPDAVLARESDASLLPGVPPLLRHWLGVSRMLDDEGVAALRPMRAVWWA